MSGDIFGGLGNLFKGFMPQDDPNVKVMNAQSELSGLKQQETELYAQAGKKALAEGDGRYAEYVDRLRLIQANIAAAEQKLAEATNAANDAASAQKVEEAKSTCPACGCRNPEGMKFCQECGAKLGGLICVSCGEALAPGIRFCGVCGTQQPGE